MSAVPSGSLPSARPDDAGVHPLARPDSIVRPSELAQREEAVAVARESLHTARQEARSPTPVHRALLRARLRGSVIVQTLLIAVVLTALLVWVQQPLLLFWQETILFWCGLLGIPLAPGAFPGGVLAWTPRSAVTLAPSPAIALGASAVVVVLYGTTYWMRDAMTPVKYLVRALCVLQLIALAFFLVVPSWFAYSVPQHVQSMLSAGYILMLAVPVLISGGYALLRIPAWERLAHPLLLLVYFAVMVPHQAVLHAWLLQHLSVVVMPVLYLCFGVVFDMLIFVALYSWLASRLTPQAME